MTNSSLSPAAKAVLDAVAEVYWDWSDMSPASSSTIAAAALAMPDECKTADPVESYRNCIRLKVVTKPDSFVWAKSTPAPEWL